MECLKIDPEFQGCCHELLLSHLVQETRSQVLSILKSRLEFELQVWLDEEVLRGSGAFQ